MACCVDKDRLLGEYYISNNDISSYNYCLVTVFRVRNEGAELEIGY